MNILKGSKCYLIGNLQAEKWDKVVAWRDYFKEQVKDMGIIPMSPLEKVFKNFELEDRGFQKRMFECLDKGDILTVHKEMQLIRRRDLAMVDHSTFVVCVLNSEVPTFGTVEELSFSQRASKPVFVVVHPSLKKLPLWIAGMFKPECFYNTLDEVIADLRKIDSGEKVILNKTWRIFEDSYA